MGKEINSIAIDKIGGRIISLCHLNDIREGLTTDSFDTVYQYEILLHYIGESDVLVSIEILDCKKVAKFIDNEDCLPDVGLLDYEDEELGLDLRNKTLREIYKAIFEKIGLIH